MESESPSPPKRPTDIVTSLQRVAVNVFLLTAGSCIYAIGLNGVLIPQEFLSGGVIGVALIFHYFIPALNTGLAYFLLNIPLMALGWFSVSRRFILYTLFGMSVFSLATGLLVPNFKPIGNPILAAVLAGIICGAGAGVMLRSQGSGGGLDILAVFLSKKWGIKMGASIASVSALVLMAGAWFFDLERALYSLIFVYTCGRVTDEVLTGFNQRKSVLIISDYSETIAEQILTRLQRGVTFLDGTGGYTNDPKKVILTIITLTELAKLKEMVFDIDRDAFVVINDTVEVLGWRHGKMKEY